MKIKVEVDISSEVADMEFAIKRWISPGANGLASCYASDRKNLRKILSLIKKGKLEEARSMAWSLDTIVREQIPNSVWTLIDR